MNRPILCSATLLLLAVLAGGCAGPSRVEEDLPPPVVERTSNMTTWSTPGAIAAAAAAAAAASAARAAPRTPPAPPRAAPAAPPPRPAPPPAAPPAPAAAAEVSTAPAAIQRVVYFDFDRYDIKDEFKPMLERRAQALVADRGKRYVVEGHADERGSREYNLALGQKRAEAVVSALELMGVQHEQLEPVSFGDTRPAVEGSDEVAWSQNRRAELVDP